MNRRLSAVLVADVVGWTTLTARDEGGALAALNDHRAHVFDPAVARHGGRVVKLTGDGALVEFASVADAVACAIEAQTASAGAGSPIVLRIGVNLGDVILQDGDIYGDGVNVAARLEALAAPGGVCVSGVVRESLGGRIDAAFTDGGEVAVKNLDRPIRVWRGSPDAAPAPRPQPQPARAPTVSLAVLPFENMSGDPEQAYFSDGVSEDVITDLAKVSGLTVIARNSSFAYRGRAVDLRTVGRELGVSHVLEGAVRRAGDRARVTAQLVDAATGAQLWADRYDRDLSDIFAVQDEVTLAIVAALKVRLSPGEQARIEQVGTTDMAAHDCFLRLRRLLMAPNMDAALWRDGIAQGERAVALDPGFIEARALLAIMRVYDYHTGWSGAAPGDALAAAGALAEAALALGPADPWANHAVAVVARWRGDYPRAAAALDVTLSACPDNALALFTRSEVSIASGRAAEAVGDLERAIRLDPAVSHMYLQYLGMAHFLLGHFETAALLFRERLLLVPGTDLGRAWLAAALGHLGEIDQARRVWAELTALAPDFSMEARLARQKFTRPSDPALVTAGLAAAGLP
jgi:adenylate cyclase